MTAFWHPFGDMATVPGAGGHGLDRAIRTAHRSVDLGAPAGP
jgi:hypothetical protein